MNSENDIPTSTIVLSNKPDVIDESAKNELDEEYYQGNEMDDLDDSDNTEYNSTNIPDSIQPDDDKSNIQDDYDDDNMDKRVEDEMDKDITKQNNKADRKPRGLPKTFMATQQKYIESLERQKRMMQSKKTKNKNTTTKKPIHVSKSPNQNSTGMRRIIVAGKVKYIPVIQNNNSIIDNIPIVKKLQNNQMEKMTKNDNIKVEQDSTNQIEKEPSNQVDIITKNNPVNVEQSTEKKIPSSIAQKANDYLSKKVKQSNVKKGTAITNKIPSKYAQQIENNVRKQTIKNIKNLSELRRIKEIQEIDPNSLIDASRASIFTRNFICYSSTFFDIRLFYFF